jgi:hypothetical protein
LQPEAYSPSYVPRVTINSGCELSIAERLT